MSVKIKSVQVDTSALNKRFTAMSRRAADFGPVFRWATQQLAAEHSKLFATNGAVGGSSPWRPLADSTVAWKLANGYGDKGILVRDGTLKSSLTDMNSMRGAVRDTTATSLTFGTEVEYARYHFYGTRKMPARKFLFVPEYFSWRTASATGKYIVYGNIPKGLSLMLP